MVQTRVTDGERGRKPPVDTSAIVTRRTGGLRPPLARRSVLPAFDPIGTAPKFGANVFYTPHLSIAHVLP
jgi:hypothetical protein